ncbi:hypothetical protein [Streptomyces sp. ME18-1-4]|uniref:hypothetical protein n=1 Tax=Streptomyces sp. ME18-1-4 TaxID=3028685 RepID=UPI0029A429D3|nr:hypothetical protein [Streptomyces sp. ME18-1-4]MDX3247180.1 hypothetical protein [Streptomyces sp. ME18-1-4]
MKTPANLKDKPPILYGAAALAVASLVWSAYSITDLMDSGPYGLTVALAGDIGWITVLWAEANSVTIAGRTWPATVAGWLIAVGVGVLLAVHGAAADEHATAQAIAGPFVVAVGKLVWLFALASMKDPAALTPEQEAEIHSVMRDSEYEARLHGAEIERIERAADTEIARINAEARTVLARDDVNFEVGLARIRKRDEIARRTPLAITAGPSPEQPAEVIGEPNEQPPIAPIMLANNPSEQLANNPLNRPNPVPDQPSIADLVREQIANTTNNTDAINNVMASRPDANRDSVAAAVRRARRKAGPYL